ncbi:hypothetical protein ACQUF8_14755 [Bacillus subtilis]|uniref:hypothetical protein n=1 Tax=Bacillus subtilis TaxID=1423 RepID=UPI003D173A48
MKPTITKEQAEAIDSLRNGKAAWDDEDFLYAYTSADYSTSPEFQPIASMDIMTLAAALVNGYEVEKTPEEKVRELYNQHRHEAACSFTDEGTNLSLGKAFGIKEASKVFGVDVEGWDEFDNV